MASARSRWVVRRVMSDCFRELSFQNGGEGKGKMVCDVSGEMEGSRRALTLLGIHVTARFLHQLVSIRLLWNLIGAGGL